MHVCARAYLKGSHAELDTQAQINVEVVGQKIEEHVVSAKQRDEEEGGLSQASVGQKERTGGAHLSQAHVFTGYRFTQRHAQRRANHRMSIERRLGCCA